MKKINKTLLFVAIISIFSFQSLVTNKAYAAFVRDLPVARIQPNGDTLHCFATGDEFYHRLHDANGFTIIMNPATGWFVYADKEWNADHNDWRLVPTTLIAGQANPATAGLSPNIIESRQTLEARHKLWEVPPQFRPSTQNGEPGAKTTTNHGKINNIVIFIRFSDDNEISTPYSTIRDMFNDSSANAISMHNYFWRASYGNLRIPTYFLPAPTTDTIIAYQDIYPRSYYMPYSSSNTNGYQENERADREFSLLERAVNWVNQNYPLSSSLNIDYNSDGMVDNICFIVKGTYTGWSDLLWPHKWSLYDRYVYLNGKRVYTFNLQLEGSGSHYFSTSTFCHEMFHTLGAPDLYHYDNYTNVTGVGIWDLMCSNTTPPQHMSIFMKMRYGKWLYSVPEITEAGTYALHSVGDSIPGNNCYRIKSCSPNQWYYLEYRDNTELFETGLPGRGLIVFRIDERFNGNSSADLQSVFDEVYVFRPDANDDTTNGSTAQAFFSSQSGRTSFTPTSNPFPRISGNIADTTLYITNIGIAGDSITFTYTPHRPTPPSCDGSTCTLDITLRDQSGDDWNGAYMTFEDLEGNVYDQLSIGDCKTIEHHTLEICNSPVTVRWHGGSYDSECGYMIRLGDGSLWRNIGSVHHNDGIIGTIVNPCGGAATMHTITVQSNNPNNYVDGGGEFELGEAVRIHAYENNHYHFLGWHDGAYNGHEDDNIIHSTERHRTVTVLSDSIFTAIFQGENVTIVSAVANSCSGMGTAEGGGAYHYGDTVTLIATPNSGYAFDYWKAGNGTLYNDNPLRIEAVSTMAYQAYFIEATGIATGEENGVNVWQKDRLIYVVGATGQEVYVYDALGRCINNTSKADEVATFAVPQNGVYIVRTNGRSYKILVY